MSIQANEIKKDTRVFLDSDCYATVLENPKGKKIKVLVQTEMIWGCEGQFSKVKDLIWDINLDEVLEAYLPEFENGEDWVDVVHTLGEIK